MVVYPSVDLQCRGYQRIFVHFPPTHPELLPIRVLRCAGPLNCKVLNARMVRAVETQKHSKLNIPSKSQLIVRSGGHRF